MSHNELIKGSVNSMTLTLYANLTITMTANKILHLTSATPTSKTSTTAAAATTTSPPTTTLVSSRLLNIDLRNRQQVVTQHSHLVSMTNSGFIVLLTVISN